jgi:hypothetical protein
MALKELYVKLNGDDANIGNSWDSAFKSIQRALDEIPDFTNDEYTIHADDVVNTDKSFSGEDILIQNKTVVRIRIELDRQTGTVDRTKQIKVGSFRINNMITSRFELININFGSSTKLAPLRVDKTTAIIESTDCSYVTGNQTLNCIELLGVPSSKFTNANLTPVIANGNVGVLLNNSESTVIGHTFNNNYNHSYNDYGSIFSVTGSTFSATTDDDEMFMIDNASMTIYERQTYFDDFSV